MTQPLRKPVFSQKFLQALATRSKLWIVPTVLITALAGGYSAMRSATWKASQGLIVREEAGGGLTRQGRFDNADAMKTAQETILEVARNPSVVETALREIGPPQEAPAANWPGVRDVEQAQQQIEVTPPEGAEFGKTELIYLCVMQHDKQRAVALACAVCNQLDIRLRELRDKRRRASRPS